MFSFQPNQLTQAFQFLDPELPDPLACSRQDGVEANLCLAMAFALRSAFCLYFDETLSTLNYAARTMNIRNNPVVQMDQKDQIIS